MPRPQRSLWVPRAYARRRHRTWMHSMSLASVGYAVWWAFLVHAHFAPQQDWAFYCASAVSSLCAGAGLVQALATLRARRSWLLFAAVAIFANASLLALPWLAGQQLHD